MTRASTTRGKTSVILLVLLLLAGGGALFAYLSIGDGGATEPAEAAGPDEGGVVEEAARAEYLKTYVALEGLKVEPDVRTDTGERVPGLLKVSGTIRNNGPKKLPTAVVAVYPKDETGKVLGSSVEDVVKKSQGLAPGESRDFLFRIPDKKGFSGDFGHSLR